MNGRVFNILRYTVDDGPGTRSTVFLKGCPLKCPWCANPESQKPYPELSFRETTCIGCGRCAALCPQHCIEIVNGKARIDREKCDNCMKCADVCLNTAMKCMGEDMSINDVMKIIRRDKDFYDESGGGVTVSGGEPMMQSDFVAKLFKQLHDEGITTCIDTTGYFSREAMDKVIPHTDLVLFDLKHMDSDKHLKVVGVPTEPLHENLLEILKRNVEVIFRIPFIPGFNDNDKNIEETAVFVKENAPHAHVDILPYHEFGRDKYGSIGMKYRMPPTERPSDEQLAHCKEFFTNLGLDCQVRM